MKNRNQLRFLIAGLFVALLLAGGVSYYASSKPDGLEKVAQDKGFIADEKEHATGDSPLAGYGVKGVDNQRLSSGLAGVLGVAITVVIAGGLFVGLRASQRRTQPATDH